MRYQGTESWVIAYGKKDALPITEEQYLFVKREIISGGVSACRGALAKLSCGFDEEAQKLVLGRLAKDSRRDDVHLGKCMHCMFNKRCNSLPPLCAYIDSRIRRYTTSFKVWEYQTQWESSERKLLMVYDCGWAMYGGKIFSPEAKKLSDYEWPFTIEPTFMLERCRPFKGGLCLHHIMPNRGEDYAAYKVRVDRYKSEIANMVQQHNTDTQELQMRRIINKLGQHDVLMSDYGGDVRFMLADYWPKKTMEQVIAMYAGGTATVEEGDDKYIKAAIAEREKGGKQ